ncbi:MAG TPA: carboxypeptidase-like regulatory domain-containing protein, partial [Polyangiales bacterium]|nr:carboxypeptidase-like regulatory domain-containing protein [Polyangiales bacterium]
TGGLYLLDGRNGAPGAVRAQLGIDGFGGSSVFVQGDHVTVSNQSLSLSVTATDNLEFFATLNNRAANETRPDNRSLDAIGDVSIGAKVGARLGQVVDIGGDLRGTFMDKVGGGTFDWGATSLWLRSALSIDLQRLDRPVPFIARFNIGYMLDNSGVLVRSTENARYDALNTSTAKGDEVLHLINRFEREAMGINRLDRFTFGAGVEVPLELAKQFYLHPIVEWQLGLPVNRQDYDCPFVASDPRAGKRATTDDSCYERTPSVIPMNLSIAARIVPPVRGLSALIGVDIGLTGTNTFVRELAPNLPWRILFAVSFDYDARPLPPPTVVAPPPVAAVVAPVVALNARIQGVVATPEGMPVVGALVHFTDRELTTLSTGADGRFVTEPLPPGPVTMDVTAPDYQPGQCSAVVPEGGVAAEARCTLTPKPLVGKLQGQLLETTGAPVSGARVIISGPTQALELSDDRGNFVADQLVPGGYTVRIEAGGYFIKLMRIDIVAHADTN